MVAGQEMTDGEVRLDREKSDQIGPPERFGGPILPDTASNSVCCSLIRHLWLLLVSVSGAI